MSYRGGNRGANRGSWRGRGGAQSNGGPPVKKYRAEDDFDDMDIDMEEFEDIDMNGGGGQEIPLELEAHYNGKALHGLSPVVSFSKAFVLKDENIMPCCCTRLCHL